MIQNKNIRLAMHSLLQANTRKSRSLWLRDKAVINKDGDEFPTDLNITISLEATHDV